MINKTGKVERMDTRSSFLELTKIRWVLFHKIEGTILSKPKQNMELVMPGDNMAMRN